MKMLLTTTQQQQQLIQQAINRTIAAPPLRKLIYASKWSEETNEQ